MQFLFQNVSTFSEYQTFMLNQNIYIHEHVNAISYKFDTSLFARFQVQFQEDSVQYTAD